MHQTITSRKAIYIPHSIDVIPLDELASRLAATIHDPSGTDAEWSRHNDLTRVLKADFVRAGGAGQLVVRHPVAHVPVQPDTQGAVVLVDDAARYLAESGSRFRITRHIQALPFVGLHPLQPVPLADVPHMVARAMYPESDDEVMEVHGYGVTNFEVQSRIERAQMLGELTLINPTDGQPLPFSSPHACVAAGDLCDFFSGGAEKQPPAMAPAVPLPAPVTWQGHTYQPGPELTPEEADEAAAWADAVNKAEGQEQVERQNWVVTKYERDTAYRPALHRYLLSEWQKGRLRKPTARDVIEAWSANKPQGIYEVMQDGVKYIDNSGNIKELSLAALKAAIGRITKVHA